MRFQALRLGLAPRQVLWLPTVFGSYQGTIFSLFCYRNSSDKTADDECSKNDDDEPSYKLEKVEEALHEDPRL